MARSRPWSLLLGLAACAAPPGGAWSVAVENDTFSGEDGGYSSGVGLGWTSRALGKEDAGTLAGRLAAATSALPGLAGADRTRHVGFLLRQTIFTPLDIQAPEPPPGEPPYAGVLALDTTVHARSADELDSWTLMLGLVGPSSLASDAQTWAHHVAGTPEPQGWDHQLRDEALVNLDWAHARRFEGQAPAALGGLEWDATPSVVAALGNYATHLGAGLTLRLGRRLPDALGVAAPWAGRPAAAPVLGSSDAGPEGSPWWHVLASARGFLPERFLPQDGNTWGGPGVETEDAVGALTLGLGLGWGRLAASAAWTFTSDAWVGQEASAQYASFALTWRPG